MATNSTNPSVFLLPEPVNAAALNSQDLQFIAQAAAANRTEITESQLAATHSSNAAVQIFGQWMETDHSAVNTALSGIAKQLGVPATATLSPQQTQEIQILGSVYGTSFNQLYAQDQVAAHQQSLALFEQEASSGANPTLVALAGQAIPVLEQHLAGAQQLTGAAVPPPTVLPVVPPPGIVAGSSAPAGTPSAQDISFVQSAAQAGLTEVQEGKLAAADTSSPAVSEFGRWMVADHTAVGSVLQTVAQQEGIAVPAAPSSQQQAEIVNLQSLPASALASSYTRDQITDHVNTLLQFVQEAATGHDPAIKAFAENSIPLLASHLLSATDLGLGQLGISSNTGPFSLSTLSQLASDGVNSVPALLAGVSLSNGTISFAGAGSAITQSAEHLLTSVAGAIRI